MRRALLFDAVLGLGLKNPVISGCSFATFVRDRQTEVNEGRIRLQSSTHPNISKVFFSVFADWLIIRQTMSILYICGTVSIKKLQKSAIFGDLDWDHSDRPTYDQYSTGRRPTALYHGSWSYPREHNLTVSLIVLRTFTLKLLHSTFFRSKSKVLSWN